MAERTGSETILFLATHHCEDSESIEDWELLSIGDLSSSVPGAGIFFYTHDMPLVLNSNIGVAIGLANGTFGKAKGFILDPTSSIYRISRRFECLSRYETSIMCLYGGRKSEP